jgi:hypothetical protein
VVQVGAGGGNTQGSSAVWLELAHEMLHSLGLLQEVPGSCGTADGGQSGAGARHIRITEAGEEELRRIQAVLQRQNEAGAAACGTEAARAPPVTARMRTRRLATQALTLCCASAPHQVAQQVWDIVLDNLLVQPCYMRTPKLLNGSTT